MTRPSRIEWMTAPLTLGLALAALMLMPSVAEADDGFDPALAEACLASPVPADCVGTPARACMETPQGSSTVGTSMCLSSEYAFWDAELNRTYTALRDRLAEMDAELDALDSAAPRSAPALRDAQRAWIAWRDATCDYERTKWGGGTGAGPAQADCLLRLTATQALRLDRDLSEVDG